MAARAATGLAATAGLVLALCTSSAAAAAPAGRAASTSDDADREYRFGLGHDFGRVLAREGLVVRGTVREVIVEPARREAGRFDASRRVVVEVGEVVAGHADDLPSFVTIDAGLYDHRSGRAQHAAVWRRVSPEAGGPIVAALGGRDAPGGASFAAVHVVTDRAAISSLDAVVAWHREAVRQNAFSVDDAMSRAGDAVFLGYLTALARSAQPPVAFLDETGRVRLLRRIAASDGALERARLYALAALGRAIASAATSSAETDEASVKLLVEAAADPALGRSAIEILYELVESGAVDLRPFVTPRVRDRLVANFEANARLREKSAARFRRALGEGE